MHTGFPVLSPSPQEAGCGGLNNAPPMSLEHVQVTSMVTGTLQM